MRMRNLSMGDAGIEKPATLYRRRVFYLALILLGVYASAAVVVPEVAPDFVPNCPFLPCFPPKPPLWP